jgi:hypothetical protein
VASRASNPSGSVVSYDVGAGEVTHEISLHQRQLHVALTKHRKIYRFVWLHPQHIISIQEPANPLTGECKHGLLQVRGPVHFGSLQAFVPDDEAALLPHEQLQFVTPDIDERKQSYRHWILFDDVLRKDSQSVYLLS